MSHCIQPVFACFVTLQPWECVERFVAGFNLTYKLLLSLGPFTVSLMNSDTSHIPTFLSTIRADISYGFLTVMYFAVSFQQSITAISRIITNWTIVNNGQTLFFIASPSGISRGSSTITFFLCCLVTMNGAFSFTT